MAYTIAQNAGKRATSGSPKLMATDSDHPASSHHSAPSGHSVPAVRIVSNLHNDARLLIGAEAIAGHTGREAGLAETAQEHLATATKAACDEIFSLADADAKSPPEVNLTASRFPDRIEITLELSIAPENRGVGRDGKYSHKLLEDGLVDQVQRETRDGRPAIVLTKYCRPVKSTA
jgi:hypothetical protein